MHNFRELQIWQRSRKLANKIYAISKKLPPDELYGLTSQIRRAVVSNAANIDEGCGRNSDKEPKRFLDIANGSAFELETLLFLCGDMNYISEKKL